MPDLPTITVTQPQATRILAAFGDAASYKQWLRERVRDEVVNREIAEISAQAEADMKARRDEIVAEIPDA